MPDTPLNPDALMGRVAGIIDSECELYGATVDGDPGEKLYGEGTDLPIRTSEKVMELIHPHLAVAQPVVNSVEANKALLREAMAMGWDAAIKAIQYPDGSPVEIMINQNPYRGGKP